MKLVLWISMIALLFCLAACAAPSVMMTVKRPAEINMKNFKKIAVGDLSGGKSTHSNDLMEMFTTKLVSANYFEAVVDRQNLKGILSEHNLNSSGLVDENSSAQLGQFLGAAALVFGRIQTDDYKEKVTYEDYKSTDSKTKVTTTTRRYTRTGTYNLVVHVQVSDVQSAKIIGVKDLSAAFTGSQRADNSEPGPIDVNSLYSAAVNSISDQFMKMVVPYEVTVKAEFETDNKALPELGLAVKQIQIGETNEAIKMFTEATQKQGLLPKTHAKAYYDLGIVQMYVGQYEDSINNLKEAYKLNPIPKYMNAINSAKKEKAAADKLKEQTS